MLQKKILSFSLRGSHYYLQVSSRVYLLPQGRSTATSGHTHRLSASAPFSFQKANSSIMLVVSVPSVPLHFLSFNHGHLLSLLLSLCSHLCPILRPVRDWQYVPLLLNCDPRCPEWLRHLLNEAEKKSAFVDCKYINLAKCTSFDFTCAIDFILLPLSSTRPSAHLLDFGCV